MLSRRHALTAAMLAPGRAWTRRHRSEVAAIVISVAAVALLLWLAWST